MGQVPAAGTRRSAIAQFSNICSNELVTRPKPIRYDRDTWLVMRDDAVIPKAVVHRYTDKAGIDQYLVVRWDLDPSKRRLMAVCTSLERADDLVRYDNNVAHGYWDGAPNPHPGG